MPIISENWKMRPKHNWYSKIIRKYYKIRVSLTKSHNPIHDSDILEKAEQEKQLVIQIPFGGLGDHIAYSSLPELLWEQKGIKTFISDKSIFRSEPIRDFVWKLNPYIEFTGQKGWFIYKPLLLKNNFLTIDKYLQNLFGLRGDGCPKVYYKPNPICELKGKTIVDPSFGPTGKANGYYEPDFHKRFTAFVENNIGDFILIAHKETHIKNPLETEITRLLKPQCYEIGTLEELADALFSAKSRYLLHSGAASLSVALNLQSNILNYLKPSSYTSYKYTVNNYINLK